MSNNTTKIISLELINCKRLALNKIKRFKLELKESEQLILGTNGSGKSSIVYELSPLPASKDNYFKNGKKIVVLEKSGVTFTLTSDFTKGNHHSFISDGEELNPGGTVTVQKELVKEVFGITVEIHEMMLGYEQFTSMSPSRRREWLTTLCSVDYTYALKTYKRVQESLRDTQGALKIAKKRLVSEMAACMNEDDITQLRERHHSLSQEAQSMYLLRNANTPSVHTAKSRLEATQSTIAEMVAKFRTVRSLLKSKSYIAPEEYQETIDQLRHDISSLDARYAALSEEYMRLSNDNAGDVVEIDSSELEALQSQLVEKSKLYETILSERVTSIEINDAERLASTIESIREQLTQALTTIPSNVEKKLSGARYSEVMELISVAKTRKGLVDNHHAQQRHALEHLESLASSQEINCPKCEHRFITGYDKAAHERAIKAVAETNEKRLAIEEELKHLEMELEFLTAYRESYRTYVQISRSTPVLQWLWDLVASADLLDTAPNRILVNLQNIYSDTLVVRRADFLKEEIGAIKRRIELAEYAKSEMFKAAKQRCEALSNEISSVLATKRMHEGRLQTALADKRDLLAMEELRKKIQQNVDSIDTCNEQLIDALKNDIIDTALSKLHSEIGEISARINSADLQIGIVTDLHSQINELELNEKAYKAIAATLSPVDGLIAEGMLGFIRHYVDLMNAMIARVWTYPMQVQDCSMDDDSVELNYKFPVLMDGMDDPVPDVSKGSSAMIEIVNLAFRIVASQCLGLDKGPLALDEFGKTFDDAHRESAIHVVQQLMEQLSYSQLFMISHYQATYGAFYNAQITVVDKRNITVPAGRKYNQHTIIES